MYHFLLLIFIKVGMKKR